MPYEVDALTRIIYRHRVVLLQNRSSILSWQAYWWIAHSPWPNFNNPLRVMSWTPVHFLSPDWTDHWWIELSTTGSTHRCWLITRTWCFQLVSTLHPLSWQTYRDHCFCQGLFETVLHIRGGYMVWVDFRGNSLKRLVFMVGRYHIVVDLKPFEANLGLWFI